jgi:hypothetical protein
MCPLGLSLIFPPGAELTEDLLTVILESKVALSFEGLWMAGIVRPNTRQDNAERTGWMVQALAWSNLANSAHQPALPGRTALASSHGVYSAQ